MSTSLQNLYTTGLITSLGAFNQVTVSPALANTAGTTVAPTNVEVSHGCEFVISGNDVIVINTTAKALSNVRYTITRSHSDERASSESDAAAIAGPGTLVTADHSPLVRGAVVVDQDAVVDPIQNAGSVIPLSGTTEGDLGFGGVVSVDEATDRITINAPGTYKLTAKITVSHNADDAFAAGLRQDPAGAAQIRSLAAAENPAAAAFSAELVMMDIVVLTDGNIDGSANVFDLLVNTDNVANGGAAENGKILVEKVG